MRVRRFVYVEEADAVIEVSNLRTTLAPGEVYTQAEHEYRERSGREASDRAGAAMIAAALDKADRREFAHTRFGDERLWSR